MFVISRAKKFVVISVSILVLLSQGSLFIHNSEAQYDNEAKLKVTLMIFSGRPNPFYFIEEKEIKDRVEILLDKAEKSDSKSEIKHPEKSKIIRSRLGYQGILIENDNGRISGFPHFIAIYRGDIEAGDEQSSCILTDTEDTSFLENLLLKRALEKGAIDDYLFNSIVDTVK